MSSDTRIRLRVSNHKAYVWDIGDIAQLRAKHHICGILTGTLPHLSQQNVFLGVPLVLMPEEVVLLVEKELAVLIDDPRAHTDPSPSELQKWNADRLESIRRRTAHAEAKEAASPAHTLSEAALRKRKDREAKRAMEKSKVEDSPVTNFTPENSSVCSSSPAPLAPLAPHSVLVPASSSSFEWCLPERCTYTTISAARAAGIWEYPSTLHERAKCGVFKGLWEKGNFMGGGIKFGGDYLVYPGDPLRYHSHFVASVIDSPTSTLRPMEIVAHGRLGTATKKAHLLCGWDDEKQEVSYFSIEWAGFG